VKSIIFTCGFIYLFTVLAVGANLTETCYSVCPSSFCVKFQVTKQDTKAASHKNVECVTLVSRTCVINSWVIKIFGWRNVSPFVEV